MANTEVSVTVIGGGVVGRACAWQIAQSGTSVRIIDAGEPRFGTSMANAGLIAPSHVIPFAAPGMVSMGIKEFFKNSGAFGVSPRAGAAFASWSLAFIKACTQEHVDHCAPALTQLLNRSVGLFDDLTDNHGLSRAPRPLYYIFSSDKAEHHLHQEMEMFARYGVPTSQVDLDKAHVELPILKDTVKAVLELSTDFGLDPRRVVTLLGELNHAAGVEYRDNENVTALKHHKDHVEITTNHGSWSSDYVVLAAGAWSKTLARMLGDNLNMIAAKGHSVTLPNLTELPTHPMILAEQRITANPAANGYRISTGYTLTSPDDRSIEPAAINKLLATAGEILHLPERAAEIQPWTGVRPSSPDGLPHIGPLKNAPRVIAATGHGMIGTMQSLGTGALVADIISGRPISTEMLKFSPSRPSA